MEISVKSGRFDVIGNGVLFSYDKESIFKIKLNFNEGGDNPFIFTVQFEFIKDDKNGGIKLKTDEDNGVIILKCMGFDSTFGTGNVEPIELATYNGGKIYLRFQEYLLGDATRKLEYCFYQEKNGENEE